MGSECAFTKWKPESVFQTDSSSTLLIVSLWGRTATPFPSKPRSKVFQQLPHNVCTTRPTRNSAKFIIRNSYTIQHVNMRVSWIMNMPSCDTGDTIYIPGSRHAGLIMPGIICVGHPSCLWSLIWVSFCRTGKMSKLCPKKIIFGASLWPIGSTFSTFLNCSEEILSCTV